ncbi:MAG: ABC transporter permease [Gammaproteobacteria bacterium]|nr:ABC transporter permease [Gammaproteobacteria bacterium]
MWEIYKKELLELVRDKRTLIFTILLPTLIMPLLMGGVVYMIDRLDKKAKNEELAYIVQNAQELPQLVTMLEAQKNFKRLTPDAVEELSIDTIKEQIQDKKYKFAVVINSGSAKTLAEGKQATVDLYYNSASITNKVYQRVKPAIESFNEQHQGKLLARFNFDEESLKGLTKPLDINRVNTADKREDIGEKIGGFLPYILLILILSGAMYPALDLGVGEKERGTLETLLLTPVSRGKLVLAKFLVIFSTGFFTVFLTIASIVAWMLLSQAVFALESLNKLISIISAVDVFLVFAMLVPVAAIFASLLLCTSIYAKNYKEAQNYMSPIMMFTIVPIIFSILPGVQLDSTWAWVPLTNVALAIKEIVKGTIDYGMMGIIFLSTTMVAGALLYFCVRWFNRESVLFRT